MKKTLSTLMIAALIAAFPTAMMKGYADTQNSQIEFDKESGKSIETGTSNEDGNGGLKDGVTLGTSSGGKINAGQNDSNGKTTGGQAETEKDGKSGANASGNNLTSSSSGKSDSTGHSGSSVPGSKPLSSGGESQTDTSIEDSNKDDDTDDEPIPDNNSTESSSSSNFHAEISGGSKPYDGNPYEFTTNVDGLKEDHFAVVTPDQEITEPGTYTVGGTVTIYDSMGNDVTDEYGTVSVEKGTVTIYEVTGKVPGKDEDKPNVPSEPEKPEEPEVPVIPEEPDAPVVPEKPEIPEEPDKPEVPEKPVIPEEPTKPEEPVIPEKPEVPDVPDAPAESVSPEKQETPDIPQEEVKEPVYEDSDDNDESDYVEPEDSTFAARSEDVVEFKDVHIPEIEIDEPVVIVKLPEETEAVNIPVPENELPATGDESDTSVATFIFCLSIIGLIAATKKETM